MHKKNANESGQILVILVLAVAGLLGFTALALDGGMVYSDRRYSQNGSDAAALAGGGAAGLVLDQVLYNDFTCSHSDVNVARQAAIASAINRAASNGFTIDTDISDHHGVTTQCVVYDNGSWEEKYVEVQVDLTSDVATALIHYFFSGEVRNEVESVTRIRPRTGLGYGNAIVSLSPNCGGTGGGIHFDGGGIADIDVNGGGIFSNSCIVVNGSANDVCVDGDTSGSCDGDGDMTYVTNFDVNGSPIIDGVPGSGTGGALPEYYVEPPDCSAVPNYSSPISHKDGGTISPGNYSKIELKKNEILRLRGGVYCMHGNFKATNGEVILDNPLEGVTIYMVSGDFETTGNAEVNLSAPTSPCTYCPEAIVAMLIYMADGHSGNISMHGGAGSAFTGTIYAPDGEIDVGGTGTVSPTFNTQIIGWEVKIHGTVDFDINYAGALNFTDPASLDLHR